MQMPFVEVRIHGPWLGCFLLLIQLFFNLTNTLILIFSWDNRHNSTSCDAESPEPAVPAGRHDVGGPRGHGVGLC